MNSTGSGLGMVAGTYDTVINFGFQNGEKFLTY
jgi:hypothetical protein